MNYLPIKLSSFLLFCSLATAAKPIKLKAGLIITSSTQIEKQTYIIKADTGYLKPLVVIKGDNIVVDFAHAILQGAVDRTRPNEFYGLAILVAKGSRNITLKNANIHGYKIAVMADSVTGLKIEKCNLSYNWRQQLHSGREREDVSDWMSFHHNEKDEWLRYGAAIYLKDCNSAIITKNIVTNGQCALMMTNCSNSEVYNNNFSFNSAIGIGMYRSSNNKIYLNRLDWNVRGYSHGKYHRGQDSAGILVFEQCNNNVFAYNSATHSGDGFFLWAGQTTMDTGTGGCNDNLLYGNDFSYAPTNGVEVTFSRNVIDSNIIEGCDHGVWGGYSYNTSISNNRFAENRIAIAIEHGQDNEISANTFTKDKTAIRLWSRAQQPADWIYAQKKDTRSKGYEIVANTFNDHDIVLDLMGTDSLRLIGNVKKNNRQSLKKGDRLTNIDSTNENDRVDVTIKEYPQLASIPHRRAPTLNLPKGRQQMLITEWGPYNFQYPILWLTNVDSAGLYYFDVLGPRGVWKLGKLNGFELVSKGVNNVPAKLILKPVAFAQNRNVQLIYGGITFKDAFGVEKKASNPYSFGYSEFKPNTQWKVNWFKWDLKNDPNKDYSAFEKLLTNDPVYSETTSALNYTWWGAIGKNLPVDSFATVANSTIEIAPGNYELGITADDLVKVFIDGKEVINAWNAADFKYDEYMHHSTKLKLGGKHQIKIIHVENGGFATLMFYLKPLK